jgi:RNA polymerase sigma-70 factor (ECF subfamily)
LFVEEASLVAAKAPPDAAPVDSTTLFQKTYEEQFDYVWNTLKRLGIGAPDREDLCHDVFIAFYRGLRSYDRARPIRPWLFGIAFRVASDFRRRARHRHEVVGEAHQAVAGGQGADDQVAARQDRELVMRGLAVLDLDRRAVFIMHEIDGCSMPEIARVLDAPLNTLYSRLRLARQAFTEAIRSVQRERKGGR